MIPAVIVAAALAGGAFWYAQSGKPADAPGQLTLYGNVDIHQVSLAFNANERIAELRVREGDKVRAGQLLGALDKRTATLRLAQAQAQTGIQQQSLGEFAVEVINLHKITLQAGPMAAASRSQDLPAFGNTQRFESLRDVANTGGILSNTDEACLDVPDNKPFAPV